jgi:hypothetical protein
VDDVALAHRHFLAFYRYEPRAAWGRWLGDAQAQPPARQAGTACASSMRQLLSPPVGQPAPVDQPARLWPPRRDFSKVDATLDVDSLPPPDIKGTIRDRQCVDCA